MHPLRQVMSSTQQAPASELEELDRRGISIAATRPTKQSSWWQRHIAPDVPMHTCRDFYALERTYLAWLRSSTALAHFGVVVTQLFRLSKTQSPRIARLGKPLGLVSISLAILVISVGGLRSWQQQRLILNGKVRSGGWDICMLILLLLGYMLVILVFVALLY